MALSSASVAVAEPLSGAARVLPITDLNLSVGTVAHCLDIQRCSLAVGIDASTIAAAGYCHIIVLLASAVCVV